MAPPPTATVETPVFLQSEKAMSVKDLAAKDGLASIPSSYSFSTLANENSNASQTDSLPVIDFAKLTSSDPQLRSEALAVLEMALTDWGFFLLINHGVPESLMKEVLNKGQEFFDMPVEEKAKFSTRDVWNPVRWGTSIDVKIEKFHLWRDFLKTFVNPEWNFPNTPEGFSEVAKEYYNRTRAVYFELLKAISVTLGLEEDYIEKKVDTHSGLVILALNQYPVCPQPDLAMGIPAHTDPGLLTLLFQNNVDGLQIQHKGEWFNVKSIPNCIEVNTGDHLEVLTNGKYPSVLHRAVVNSKAQRISVPMSNGPPLDACVVPAKELLEKDGSAPLFKPVPYKEYIAMQHTSFAGKCIDYLRYD